MGDGLCLETLSGDGLTVSDFCVSVLCRGPLWEKGHGELAKGHNGRGVIKGQGHAILVGCPCSTQPEKEAKEMLVFNGSRR